MTRHFITTQIDDRAGRIGRRSQDRIALKVACEKAAQALAEDFGWDWPSLAGCDPYMGLDRHEHRRKVRSFLRHQARIAVDAALEHLDLGGKLNEPEAASMIIRQTAQDEQGMLQRHADRGVLAARMADLKSKLRVVKP